MTRFAVPCGTIVFCMLAYWLSTQFDRVPPILLRGMQPEAIRILLTGVIDIDTLMSAINQAGAFRFVPKPWDDDQLLQSIEEGLKFRDILVENKILAQTVRDQREALKSMGYEGN